MMKRTICMVFVLAFVAQICAIPTEKDIEKEVKGMADGTAAAADEAKKDATDLADKAAHTDHAKHTGDDHAKHTGGDHAKHTGDDHAEGGKHGAEGSKKPGTGPGPFSNLIKIAEKNTEELADKGLKLVTDILGLWKL